MKCAICERKISKKDVEAGQYVYSSFSKRNYHIPGDCVGRIRAKAERNWGKAT